MTPVIFGLSGPRLTADETAFLKAAKPAGIILFSRNIEAPGQARALTQSVRDLLGRDLLVLIDQEGGRVQRLKPPTWRAAPPMALFGKAFKQAPEKAERALYLNCRMLAHDLKEIGVNVDCIPVLDVPRPGSDNVIGDRAFSGDPKVVARLGNVVCEALSQGLVIPVMKHIPGHGRADADSHEALPVIDTPLEELQKTDFVPFAKNEGAPFAMTAHITYQAIDPDQPATLSKKVIDQVIRGSIGFSGILISDDITMKALDGSPGEITERCLAAGIDLVLHCSGELKDMDQVMQGVKPMTESQEFPITVQLESLEGVLDDAFEMVLEYRELEKDLKRMAG